MMERHSIDAILYFKTTVLILLGLQLACYCQIEIELFKVSFFKNVVKLLVFILKDISDI